MCSKQSKAAPRQHHTALPFLAVPLPGSPPRSAAAPAARLHLRAHVGGAAAAPQLGRRLCTLAACVRHVAHAAHLALAALPPCSSAALPAASAGRSARLPALPRPRPRSRAPAGAAGPASNRPAHCRAGTQAGGEGRGCAGRWGAAQGTAAAGDPIGCNTPPPASSKRRSGLAGLMFPAAGLSYVGASLLVRRE